MSVRQKIEAAIEKKRREIASFEEDMASIKADIMQAESYIQGLQDSLKFLPKETSEGVSGEVSLRPNSDLAKARDYILEKGQPVPILELLVGIGKEPTKANRASLAGNLGWYVRREEVFSRPFPNTFSLIELDRAAKAQLSSTDAIENVDKDEEET